MAFCKDLRMYGCEVHLYRGPKEFGCTLEEIDGDNIARIINDGLTWWENENVYFLAGVKPGIKKRASDSDVKWRGMFTLDFDIRKELPKMTQGPEGQFPTDKAQLEDMAEKIIASLEDHPTWGKFRYVVMSGNGMHIHYFGEPVEVDKEQWVAGMRDVFDEINTITPIPCDTGCGNAGRIMRMPGSWNVKDPANRKPVDILGWMEKHSLPNMAFVQERGAVAVARRNERKEAERVAFESKHPTGESTVIDIINLIPIEQVVCQLFTGLEVRAVKKDGGMRFADGQGVERGFFKHREYNIIVHEGTSLFPAPEGKGYNCLGLAKTVLNCTAREAIEWFAERSTPVRVADIEDRERWAKENETHEVAFIAESSQETNNE